MKLNRLLASLAILLVLATPLAAASSQSVLPDPVTPEPYPFSDRYPALVLVQDAADWGILSGLGIEMEGLRAADGSSLGAQFEPVVVSVYVNQKDALKLKAAGLQAVPVPNEGLRARLLDASGIFTPSGWPLFAQIETRLQTIAAAYPAITRLVSLGKSVQNRDIWCLKITDNPDAEEDEPEVKYTSSMHGDETTGMEMTLRLAEYLTANYAGDATVQSLVNGAEMWLCPLHNPDGYVASSRYNANGVDLNRDFPEAKYGQPNTSAALQPENLAFWNFEEAHSFVMGANYHGGAQVANYPWDAHRGAGDSCIISPDDLIFYAYSKGYAALNADLLAGGFTDGITLGCDWYELVGGMQDWTYNWYGEHHLTLEISDTKTPAYTSMNTYWSHNRDAMIWWFQRALMGARGLVTDANSGAPLAATISLVGEDGLPVYTDPQVGDYHRLLLAGTHTLQASAACYLPQTATLTVGSAAATVQDFALQPAANRSVSGVVTAAASSLPLPGAQVELVEMALVATATLDGSYTLDACQGTYTLRASAPGYQAVERSIILDQALIENFALPPLPPVLVVDDDDNESYQTYYQNALTAAGYSYDTQVVSTQGSPLAADLAPYRFVVWLTGDDANSTLTSGEQSALQAYLDGGGRLFISGQEIGYDIPTTSFYQNYLHATYLIDDTNALTLAGLDFLAGTNISISGGDGANNQAYPDEVSPRSGAVSIWDYTGAYGSGGVAYKDDTYCVAYFAFGFEAINAAATRAQVMGATMDWLDECIDEESVSNLVVTKSDGLESARPGDVVTYTITLTNLGPDAVSGADLSDPLPADLLAASWSCAASSGSACSAASGSGSPALTLDLLNGGAATLTVTASVAEMATGTLQNSAAVSLPQGFIDPQPHDNQATDETLILWRSVFLPAVLR